MLPDDYGFIRLQSKWEAEEERRMDMWMDATDEEEDDDQ